MRDRDQQQLDRVMTLVREVLGPDVVGGYLFGSAVLGGLQPQSDLDVLVVSKRQTTREEKQRLADCMLALSGRSTPQGRWRRVELTIVVESEIKPWRYPPSFDFQYGDWLRGEFESGNVKPWPTRTNPDLAALITMVLLRNTPVLGPPPDEIFDPVPHDDLVSAIVGDIDALLGDLEGGHAQCAPDARADLEHRCRLRHPLEGRRRRLGARPAPRGAPGRPRSCARDLPGRRGGTLGRHGATSSTSRRPRRRRDQAANRR